MKFATSGLMTAAFGLCSVISNFGTSSGAVVLNGGFESGLSNWTVTGSAQATGTLAGTPAIAPPAGASHALIFSGDGGTIPGATLTALQNALQLGPTAFTGINANSVGGSAISQVLTGVNVGDVLTFSWNFLTTEQAQSANIDYAFFSLGRAGAPLAPTVLANANSVLSPIVGGTFNRQSGYQQASFTFTEAGDYTLGFGAINVQDPFGNSGVLIDQVALTAVPEPASSTAVLALLGVAWLRRRRNR